MSEGLLSRPGGPRHIEMRVPGGVARAGDDWDWDGFYAHVAVAPALETLSRVVRAKLFGLRDATRVQLERLCGGQLRAAGVAAPEGLFEEVFGKNMAAHVELLAGPGGAVAAELEAHAARRLHAAVDAELAAALAHFAAECHEGEEVRPRPGYASALAAFLGPFLLTCLRHPAVRAQDYFDDSWGEDAELRAAHVQTAREAFHHCLVDEA
eukprot:CAMPEP_0119274248 /NCGR_PEP_ID=MMETSP1329-20130426/11783_1 /TAXON_ID=114041 /ORGANISM="Genus nov. species nov., Strain RCC1024" /LENGTH=209 /DNA_ID=CAMNT_0007274543 /DNA_START=113 /DNA_END=738 /DNA_ORIENTATION=+